MQVPLQFHPYLRPMVWGGRGLGDFLCKSLPTEDLYGEAWEISDHPSFRSIVSSGQHSGLSIRDLMVRDAEALTGSSHHLIFPWLVKFLDAGDWLSVQVHPDEEAVRALWPGEGAKTEAWFVLDARPQSRIFAGFKPGVDESILRKALAQGTVADCLHSFQPQPGDCLFLPAGTVHAVGGGVLLAEIQQTSDATFRLFDWNRVDATGKGRKLHIEQAMQCINWHQGPAAPVRVEGYQPTEEGSNESIRQPLVRCRYFHLDYLRQREPFALSGGQTQAMMCLHGRAVLTAQQGSYPFSRGDTLLLPAAMEKTWVYPQKEVGLLLATLPSDETNLQR